AQNVWPTRLFCERTGPPSAFALVGIAIAARGRGLDHDRFAGPDGGRVTSLKFLHIAVCAPYPILAQVAGLAAGEPERPHPAMPGQDGTIHRFQESDRAAHAVTGVPLAAPARMRADVEILEQHRIAELEHLRIGQP